MADNSLKKGRYTKYSNKIGLYSNSRGSFVKNDTGVVLNFPFKDTVLEAGMSKEDKGREERFLHLEIDSKDIDTLEEPKVFTNFRLVNEQGETALTSNNDIDFFDENGDLKQNLLIKGNNLLALHTLKSRLSGKIKLIYIDPPYNTGNDGFKYNDSFNHSAWLAFMKNRLEAARDLMADDGAIFVSIKDNEYAYLKILMDEIFGMSNFVNAITVKMSELSGVKMSHVEKKLPNLKEYVLVYRKTEAYSVNAIKVRKTNNIDGYLKYYSKIIENPDDQPENWSIVGLSEYLKKNGLPSDDVNVKEYKINNAKRIVYRTNNKSFKKVTFDTKVAKFTSPNGIEYIWWEGKQMLFLSDYVEEYIGDIWIDISTINLNKEGGVDLQNGKKPEKLIERIIKLSTKPGDLVLDYHLGSGTTSAVAHKMNRRWIGIEQMDYIETLAKERLKKVVAGEQGGVSKDINWQGGGSFVYFELKKYNQEYIDRIMEATSLSELEDIYVDMRNNAFLKFWFDRSHFEKDEDFRQLDLDGRKQALADVLDENQLYLNYSDMNDTRHNVTADEKALTDAFYGTN